MQEIKLSESTAARRQIYFVAKDINNPSQPKTGLTFAAADIQVSTNGSTPANSAGSVTEVGSTAFPGLYYYTPTTGEVGTLGAVLLNFKHASMVAQTQEIAIIAFDKFDSVRMGMTALPNAAAQAAGGLYTRGTGAGQINQTINGEVDVNVMDIEGGLFGSVFGFLGVNMGQAQAGASTSITLVAGESTVTDYYKGVVIALVGGTGVGQWRTITAYNGSTKVATIDVAWATTPDATSLYRIGGRAAGMSNGSQVDANVQQWKGTAPNVLVSGRVDASVGDIQSTTSVNNALGIVTTGTAAAGAAGTITLAASASGTANLYNDMVILTTGGTGAGQARLISAYSSGKVATVVPNWTTTPDATTTYTVFACARADLGLWLGTAPNALVSGRVDSSTGAMASGVVTATAVASAAFTSSKFDNSVNIQVVRTATMQAGSTSTTAVLDASASATDNYYKGAEVYVVSGTGVGQTRQIASYVGSTKTATVNRAWVTTPDATSVFQILAADSFLQTTDVGSVWDASRSGHTTAGTFGEFVPANVTQWLGTAPETPDTPGRVMSQARVINDGQVKRSTFAQDALDLFGDIRRNTAQAGSSTTITLDASASATDDWYKNGLIVIVGGTGAGQFRTISGYVGSTKVATVSANWGTNPDATSVFEIFGAGGSVDSTSVAAAVWDASRSGHTTTGTFGEGINVVSIATAAANTVRDAVLNFSHRTGRTVKGFIRRLDALATGKAIGLLDSLVTFYQPDGATTEFSASQDTTAGSRGTADVTNSEV